MNRERERTIREFATMGASPEQLMLREVLHELDLARELVRTFAKATPPCDHPSFDIFTGQCGKCDHVLPAAPADL